MREIEVGLQDNEFLVATSLFRENDNVGPIVHGYIRMDFEDNSEIKTLLWFNVLATEDELKGEVEIKRCKSEIITMLSSVYKKLYIKYDDETNEALCVKIPSGRGEKNILIPVLSKQKTSKIKNDKSPKWEIFEGGGICR